MVDLLIANLKEQN